jgi:hypothetical protein
MTVHRKRFLVNKTNRCTEFQFYWYYDWQFHPTAGSKRSSQLHKMYQSRCMAKNSWWRAERLPETCRVVIPIKLEFSESVGFISKVESYLLSGSCHRITLSNSKMWEQRKQWNINREQFRLLLPQEPTFSLLILPQIRRAFVVSFPITELGTVTVSFGWDGGFLECDTVYFGSHLPHFRVPNVTSSSEQLSRRSLKTNGRLRKLFMAKGHNRYGGLVRGKHVAR